MKLLIHDSLPNALELSYALDIISLLIQSGVKWGSDPVAWELVPESTDTEFQDD